MMKEKSREEDTETKRREGEKMSEKMSEKKERSSQGGLPDSITKFRQDFRTKPQSIIAELVLVLVITNTIPLPLSSN